MWPTEIIDDVARGNAYLSGQNADLISERRRGCKDCTPNGYECLASTMNALNWKNSLGLDYDDIDAANIVIMLKLIGDFVIQTGPTVNAGNDQSVVVGGTATFTATETPGSSAIVSRLWTKSSGGTIDLSGITTPVLTASDFTEGIYDLTYTVIDENGLTASDTVRLTGVSDTMGLAYWGIGDAPTTLEGILAGTSFAFNLAADITIPFYVPDYQDYWTAIPNTESIKDYYEDTVNVLNKGDIGTDQDLFDYPTAVSTYYVYSTVYPVPQLNPMVFSNKNPLLTINITGLGDTYEVYVDDVLWPNHQKSFSTGTVIYNLTPVVTGYSLSPSSVSTVTMDMSKTLTFVATPI